MINLMKYNFICPICDKHYFTLIEEHRFIDLIDYKKDISEVFRGMPEVYEHIVSDGICQRCYQPVIDKDEIFCIQEGYNDEDLRATIMAYESNLARKII